MDSAWHYLKTAARASSYTLVIIIVMIASEEITKPPFSASSTLSAISWRVILFGCGIVICSIIKGSSETQSLLPHASKFRTPLHEKKCFKKFVREVLIITKANVRHFQAFFKRF